MAVAHDLQGDLDPTGVLVTRRCSATVIHGEALIGRNDIALFEAALLGWALLLHLGHQCALPVGQVKGLSQILVEVLNADAKESRTTLPCFTRLSDGWPMLVGTAKPTPW